MIQSVERAFKILEILDSSIYRENGIGAVELSKMLGLKFPTTHNFLKSMVELGYVEQVLESGKYRLGSGAYSLGRIHNNQKELLDIAVPLIDEINRALNETIILVTFENYQRNVIYQAECTQALKVSISLGADEHFYETATGRVLLSKLDTEKIEEVIKQVPLTGQLKVKELEKQLKHVNLQGYEIMKKSDVTVLGVPVYLPEKKLLAALGAFFPTARYSDEFCEKLLDKLLQGAKQIEQALR